MYASERTVHTPTHDLERTLHPVISTTPHLSSRPQGKLNWTVASELDNDYFTLERSSDGQNYEIVSRIESHSDNNIQSIYSYEDKDLMRSAYYYRLSWTDLEGKQMFCSKQVYLENSLSNNFTIHPNPMNDFIHIEIQNEIQTEMDRLNEEAKFYIYNTIGQIAISGFLSEKNSKVDVSSLPDGIYMFEALMDGHLFYQKLVK